MSSIDEVVKKHRRPEESGDEDSLDQVLKDQDKILGRELKQTSIERMIEENRVKVEEAKKRRQLVGGANSGAELAITVDKKAEAAFLKALVDSGTDANKAAEFVKALDEQTLAKIMLMSGSQSGSGLLMPLLYAASSPKSDIKELVGAAKDLVELSRPKDDGGGKISEYVAGFATMADILKGKGDGDSGLREELSHISDKLDEQREAFHQRELDFQKTVADLREGNLQAQLQNINTELQELKSRSWKDEVKSAKETLEAMGFKVGAGGREDLDMIKEVTDTIVKSPAVENLTSAVGDRIRQGGGFQRPQRSPPGSQTILCEVCAGRGVSTPLTVTPEMQAGKADLVCPVCGTSYNKQV